MLLKIRGFGSWSRSPPKSNHLVLGPHFTPSKISSKSVQNFLNYPADRQTNRQTNRQTDRQTDRSDRMTFFFNGGNNNSCKNSSNNNTGSVMSTTQTTRGCVRAGPSVRGQTHWHATQDRQTRLTTNQPASQSDSTQLKAGNYAISSGIQSMMDW